MTYIQVQSPFRLRLNSPCARRQAPGAGRCYCRYPRPRVRAVGYTARVRPTRLATEAGSFILEVLIVGTILSIAVVGLALMFSQGQTFVFAEGDERVGLYLAQQKMEELRTLGYESVTIGTVTEPAGTCLSCIPGFPRFSRVTTISAGADLDGSGFVPRNIVITVQSTVKAANTVTKTGVLFPH